jgi:nitroimidazol reductase NimA-like FMN-containing flavoprotein (pyridoxamine 5'-phosphate oxidase superfamily)
VGDGGTGATAPGDGDRLEPTTRTTLRRKKERGHLDFETVRSILDEGLLCHVGFSDGDTTYVVPMAYAPVGDVIYLHGAPANRTLRALADGAEACVTVTLLDGLVLARSAFHHSMNYRSVMLLGTAVRVDDEAEQLLAARSLLGHMAPGRGADARLPTPSELRRTLILRFPVVEGSAKVRAGGPIDDEEDMGLEVWAGVVPFRMVAGSPLSEPDLPAGVAVPVYATDHTRPGDPPR